MTFLLPAPTSPVVFREPNTETLVQMLTCRRRHDTPSHRHFCNRWLKPVFGKPDKHGNYMLVVGDNDNPSVCFMAHHDSVHNMDGFQPLEIVGKVVSLPPHSKSNCLGADDATGIWLMLHMIECNVPGRYVVHAKEESGCIGARNLILDKPAWLDSTMAAISFDRRGYDSVVTHQCSKRTASDMFSRALAKELGGQYKPDDTGVFTDSEVYAKIVPECTNISVGYFNQHSRYETQDLGFAYKLAKTLINIDWAKLPIARDPFAWEDDYYTFGYGYNNHRRTGGGNFKSYTSDDDGYDVFRRNFRSKFDRVRREPQESESELYSICYNYPDKIAEYLEDIGITREMLVDELYLHEDDFGPLV